MLSRKTIDFLHISPDSTKLAFSAGSAVTNWLRCPLYISIYFDDDRVPRLEFFAEKKFREEERVGHKEFSVSIPANVRSAKIILETLRDHLDLGAIEVKFI